MRKFHTLLFLLLLTGKASGTTYFYTRFDLQYSGNNSQDSVLWFRLFFADGKQIKRDSFLLNGIIRHEKNYMFEDNFQPSVIYFEVLDRRNKVLSSFDMGGGFAKELCEGHLVQAPFSGLPCWNMAAHNMGTVCGEFQLNFVKDRISDSIKTNDVSIGYNGGIYCEWDSANRDNTLQLSAPCYFQFKNTKNIIRWYAKAEGQAAWLLADSGNTYYPASLSSYQKNLFRKKFWFKAVVDSNFVKGDHHQYESNIYGPVSYFVGADADSVVLQRNKKCYEKNRLLYYIDSVFLLNADSTPKLWVYFKSDTSIDEERWSLGPVAGSPVDIIGHETFTEEGFPAPPMRVPYRKGRYRIACDFKPWNGSSCNLANDTIYADDSDSGYFDTGVEILKSNSCFGDSSGSVRIQILPSDTGKFWVTKDKSNYFDTGHIFEFLKAGKHDFFVVRQDGCSSRTSVTLSEPPNLYLNLQLDTTLCIGQSLFANAANNYARSITWFRARDTISKADTITLADAGDYSVLWEDKHQCKVTYSFKIQRENRAIGHSFLVPSEAFIQDTIYAVFHGNQKADELHWQLHSNEWRYVYEGISYLKCVPADTGILEIKLYGKYENCGFQERKMIRILSSQDSARSNPKLRYRGPLVQQFAIVPNPNNGINYKIKLQLRDTSDVHFYKLDPVSGAILDTQAFENVQELEETLFSGSEAREGVFYLKMVVGKEVKVQKILVSK